MMELMHGDCLEKMKDIPNGSVDLVLTDPPYGTTSCKWDSVIPFEPMWGQLKRIIKPNGVIVFTASQPFTSMIVTSNPTMFRHSWVWNKAKAANFPQVKRHPLKTHEDVLVFGSKDCQYFPQMTEGVFRQKGGYTTSNKDVAVIAGAPKVHNNKYYPKSILDFSIAGNLDAGLHPTQKPVALFEYLIKTYTNEGETVLDFTMGSGTTGVACKNLNRKFIGIEKYDKYFELARERIENHVAPLL